MRRGKKHTVHKERSISSLRNVLKDSAQSANHLQITLQTKEKIRSKSKTSKKPSSKSSDSSQTKTAKKLVVKETDKKVGASCAWVIF